MTIKYDYFPEDVLPVIIQIARDAGAILMKYFESDLLQIKTKSSEVDLVTQADIEADNFIRSQLTLNFPNAGIITEEGEDVQPRTPSETEVFFCVDPLDGTSNFASNYPHFCVSIGFLDTNHQSLAGCIFDPNRNEMFSAARGNGAYLETTAIKRKIHVRENSSLIACVVETYFSANLFKRDPNLLELKQFLPSVRSVRCSGSASLGFAWVAAGRVDAYYQGGPFIWDIAAGWIIAEESGAVFTDFHGGKYDRSNMKKDKLYIAIASPGVHKLLLDKLSISGK